MVNLKGRGLLALRIACGLCALSLLIWTFHGVELAKVRDSIGGIALPGLVLIATPALISLCVECLGWASVFRCLGQRVAPKSLLRVRMISEAVAQTLPFGVIWAESLKPALLGRHTGMPASRAVAGLVARKYLLVGSQAVYVALLSAFGFGTLRQLSRAFFGGTQWAWLAFAVTAFLGCIALGVGGTFARGCVAERLCALLQRLPNQRLRATLRQRQASFASTDQLTGRYFARSFLHTTLAPGVFFLAGWLCEALETYLIFRLLGVELDFFVLGSIEVLLSFVKNVLFILPGGIGVQDVGYVSCLTALGVPDALNVCAAFSALKRGKELLWAIIGYLLLIAEARPTLSPIARLEVDPA